MLVSGRTVRLGDDPSTFRTTLGWTWEGTQLKARISDWSSADARIKSFRGSIMAAGDWQGEGEWRRWSDVALDRCMGRRALLELEGGLGGRCG